MTIPYFGRLLCLCLAAFFLANFAFSAAVTMLSPLAIRYARRLRPDAGARLLFGLRLLPAALSSLVVLCLCAPSYLWLEPDTAVERVGTGCLAAAMLGAAIWATGAARALAASIRSARYLRNCASLASADTPLLMLAGVFHPRLVVSRSVRSALTAEQLDVAVRHEWAHGTARDNLKRLLLRLAPDTLPGWRAFDALERNWSRLAERAADDRAVAGSRERAFALASALVRVARMGPASAAPPLATSLLAETADLAARVERLLEGNSGEAPPRGLPAPAIALALCATAVVFHPSTLYAVHELLERLTR
jgi:Zn-dependent protease with chaperone function